MDNQKELQEELQEEQQAATEQQEEKKETGKQRGRKRLIAALLLLLVLAAGGAAAFWYYGQDGGKEGWQEVLHGDKTKVQKSAEQKAQLVIGDAGLSDAHTAYLHDTVSGSALRRLVYTPLVRVDSTKKAEKCLAKDIAFDTEAKQAEVTLTDAVFSDGSPVTAADVKESYQAYVRERMFSGVSLGAVVQLEGAEAYGGSTATSIEGIEIVDDTTLRFHFLEVSPECLDMLSVPVAKLSASEYPLGAGEYQITEAVIGKEILLAKSENASLAEYPYATVLLKKAEKNGLEENLKNYSLDMFLTDQECTESMLKESGWHSVYELPEGTYAFIGFRFASPKVEDPEIRRAIIQAIDRQALCDTIYGEGKVPDSILGRGMGKPNFASILPYDKKAAEKVLAGLSETRKSLTVLAGADVGSQGAVDALEEQLREYGLTIERIEYSSASSEGLPEDGYDLYLSLTEDGTQNRALQALLSGSEEKAAAYEKEIGNCLKSDPLSVYRTAEEFFCREGALIPIHAGSRMAAVAADGSQEALLELLQ